jgi:hypothetical protein
MRHKHTFAYIQRCLITDRILGSILHVRTGTVLQLAAGSQVASSQSAHHTASRAVPRRGGSRRRSSATSGVYGFRANSGDDDRARDRDDGSDTDDSAPRGFGDDDDDVTDTEEEDTGFGFGTDLDEEDGDTPFATSAGTRVDHADALPAGTMYPTLEQQAAQLCCESVAHDNL